LVLSNPDAIVADEINDARYSKLRYWELMLCIYSGDINGEQLNGIKIRLKRLEYLLMKEFMAGNKSSLEIVDRIDG